MTDVGLCVRCARCQPIESSRGSVFYRCLAAGRPKYPRLPVLSCEAYERARDPSEDDEPAV